MSDHLIPLSRQMLTSAVRYALGRQTCIVAWTVNETIRVWDELDTHTKDLIIRDVTEAMYAAPPMHIADVDRPDWQRLIDRSLNV